MTERIDDPMFKAQIERGVKRFDQKSLRGILPVDWRAKIEKDALDMSDPCDCMVGQLFDVPEGPEFSATLPEEYTEAIARLGINEDDLEDFGLDLSEDQIMEAARSDGVADMYGQLTQEWLSGPLAEDQEAAG